MATEQKTVEQVIEAKINKLGHGGCTECDAASTLRKQVGDLVQTLQSGFSFVMRAGMEAYAEDKKNRAERDRRYRAQDVCNVTVHWWLDDVPVREGKEEEDPPTIHCNRKNPNGICSEMFSVHRGTTVQEFQTQLVLESAYLKSLAAGAVQTGGVASASSAQILVDWSKYQFVLRHHPRVVLMPATILVRTDCELQVVVRKAQKSMNNHLMWFEQQLSHYEAGVPREIAPKPRATTAAAAAAAPQASFSELD